MHVDDPFRVDIESVCHLAAATDDRQIGQLRMGEQDVDVSQHIGTVPLEQSRHGVFDHVHVADVLGDVVAVLRGAEHQVVPQVVGARELFAKYSAGTRFSGR